jgi:hypothetical protein
MSSGMSETLRLIVSGDSKGGQKALRDLGKQSTATGKEMGSSVKAASAAITGGLLAAGAAVGAFMLKSRDQFKAYGKEIMTVQRLTGATVEQASLITGEMKLIGGEAVNAGDAMAFYAKNLGLAQQGGGPAAKVFDKLGINLKDANGEWRSGADVLVEFRSKLGEMTNAQQRASDAAAVMGRSYKNILPWFTKTEDTIADMDKQLKSMGLVLSDKQMETWKTLVGNEKLAAMYNVAFQVKMGELVSQLENDVMPQVLKLADALDKIPSEALLAIGAFAGITGVIRLVQGWGGAIGDLLRSVGLLTGKEVADTAAVLANTGAIEANTAAKVANAAASTTWSAMSTPVAAGEMLVGGGAMTAAGTPARLTGRTIGGTGVAVASSASRLGSIVQSVSLVGAAVGFTLPVVIEAFHAWDEMRKAEGQRDQTVLELGRNLGKAVGTYQREHPGAELPDWLAAEVKHFTDEYGNRAEVPYQKAFEAFEKATDVYAKGTADQISAWRESITASGTAAQKQQVSAEATDENTTAVDAQTAAVDANTAAVEASTDTMYRLGDSLTYVSKANAALYGLDPETGKPIGPKVSRKQSLANYYATFGKDYKGKHTGEEMRKLLGFGEGGSVSYRPGGTLAVVAEKEDEDWVPKSKKVAYARRVLGDSGVTVRVSITGNTFVGSSRDAARSITDMVVRTLGPDVHRLMVGAESGSG